MCAEFVKHPLACLTLASFLATNAGDVARRHIRDPELLHFLDIECYCWSTVPADMTPMINAGMVFCDRHYGGINYPRGGVGRLGEELAAGLREHGSCIEFRANVRCSRCLPAWLGPYCIALHTASVTSCEHPVPAFTVSKVVRPPEQRRRRAKICS